MERILLLSLSSLSLPVWCNFPTRLSQVWGEFIGRRVNKCHFILVKTGVGGWAKPKNFKAVFTLKLKMQNSKKSFNSAVQKKKIKRKEDLSLASRGLLVIMYSVSSLFMKGDFRPHPHIPLPWSPTPSHHLVIKNADLCSQEFWIDKAPSSLQGSPFSDTWTFFNWRWN